MFCEKSHLEEENEEKDSSTTEREVNEPDMFFQFHHGFQIGRIWMKIISSVKEQLNNCNPLLP